MTTLENLINWFEDKNKVMIALSGGVDSALVAYAAFKKLGNSAIAVTADYKTLSKEELDTAKQICSEIGIQQILLD
ncbi:MAG: 7-cyano-7-deazaguanine synthase, partial [Candidatus Nitrosomaritimum aestuariumsis]